MKGLLYKPVAMGLGAIAGIAAGAIFRQVWRVTAGEGEVPRATDADAGWAEVLIAAAIEGAIFAAVRAALSRGGAVGVRRITGEWPD